MAFTRREALFAGSALLAGAALSSPARAGSSRGASQFRRVQLSSGRWIAYSEYGDPAGRLVFYFHGTPGSRLEVRLIEADASQAGVRLVALDRPGLGRSSPYRGRRIVDWPADVEQVAHALGYGDTPYGVLGMSGGAPYAAACAHQLPHRLTHVAIVSGHAPLGAPGTTPGSEDKLIGLVSRRPRISTGAFKLIRRRLYRRPDNIAEKISKNWTASDRQLILCDPIRYQQLIANLQESVRCGTEGLVRDIQLLAGPWCLSLCEIHGVSVSVWQGGCDRISPPSMGRYFRSQIADSELVLDPSAGHVTMLKWHASEILARL